VWYAVGNKGRNTLRRRTEAMNADWSLTTGVMLETARDVAAKVTEDFTSGAIGGIVLISPKLVSMMSQKPETRQIVPIVAEAKPKSDDGPKGAVEFEPSAEFVLSRLLPKYLEFTIYSAMLETNAAFFAAQLIAMNNASDNAKKIIDELTLAMNKARQASITTEILEIVGGAEALAG
jgi:F-type H+-transporting ATPase subunit gamma